MEAIDLSIFAWGRVIERLFIVGFSGLSLILGWNLFVRGILVDQEASGGYKGWKITLRKVGPGVFFALFGTIVLSISLAEPLKISPEILALSKDSKRTDQPINSQTPGFSYFEKDSVSLRRTIRALNTLLLINASKVTFDGTPVIATEYKRAQSELQLMRYNLLLPQFGAAKLDAWNKFGSQSIDPTNLSPEARSAIAQVKPWFDDTMAMERN